MFKRAVNAFFNWRFSFRLLIFAVIITAIQFSDFLFGYGGYEIMFSPNEEVYSHLSQLTLEFMEKKSTDVFQTFDILDHYIKTEDTEKNKITLSLYGPNLEKLDVVLDFDYNLLSMSRRHDDILLNILALVLTYIIFTFTIGILDSFIINLILIGLKFIYENWIHKIWHRIKRNNLKIEAR